MGKEIKLNLPPADSLFSTQEERDDVKREKVLDIPLSEIDGFPDHPFQVKLDEAMQVMADSVKTFGIQTPAIVRLKEDGRYELVSGHRRKMACELAGLETMPCIVRQMSRDDAIISMVDSNLQREIILPSEKAKSYKMKLDAMKRQGQRTDLTSTPLAGNGCPYCAGKKVLAGFNDLKMLKPQLAAEWDHEKNELLPSQVTLFSQKLIWWKCKLGHSWKATVAARSRGDGCPYCSGKKVLKGFNDLETLNPKFLKEWDYEKNILLPSEVTRCSGKMVWWKCKLGHSWKIKVSSRANGSGCPYCCNQKILPGFNDLQTLNPEVAREWDYEKNKLKPYQVAVSTNKPAWWKCGKGHSWKAPIAARTNGGTGCPYCSGRSVLPGFNDLKTLNPQLCDEWDYEKNTLTPSQVTIMCP